MGKKNLNLEWNERELQDLIHELKEARRDMLALESQFGRPVSELRGARRQSAKNVVHYLALRDRLANNLRGRLESAGVFVPDGSDHVVAGIDRAIKMLQSLRALSNSPFDSGCFGQPLTERKQLIERRTRALLGNKPEERKVRIMVTVPTEAAHDPKFIHDLLEHGMDCMRINCAHDKPEIWSKMISNLQNARHKTGRHCSLLMDIPGPKLRTGPVEPGPQVLKIHPHRDDFGEVTAPARVWITPAGKGDPAPSSADACLSVRGEWLDLVFPGDTIYFEDARGSSRSLRVAAAEGKNRWAESMRTAYIVPETELHLSRRDRGALIDATATVKNIPLREQSVHLRLGDTLVVTAASIPGRPAKYDDEGRILCPATIGITCPEIFADVRPGETIWFDDGKIGGVVRSVQAGRMAVEITHARAKGENLRADKGVNLPDSDLKLPALTGRDLKILNFIARRADMVGYSFVRDERNLRELHRRLRAAGAGKLGIVLKIETRRALERLPELLLASIRHGRTGVMIARGDLAVECGFEKLAQIQEQILSLSRTAHIPVIWATQVLETLAKKGMPSRAEMTDVAMASRAQCVMLNKGPYILHAIATLDGLLRQAEARPAATEASPGRSPAAAVSDGRNIFLVRSGKPDLLKGQKPPQGTAAERDLKIYNAALASAS
ncbi:MAG TPA: pyruvate kinase [Candidatus Limnocylindrales bacterium]|nr:pyruvate kinase [Candidatus Limnocylindrales bacterium]